MRRILTWLFWGPLALIIVALAVANRQRVTFSLDPISQTDPVLSVDLPLFVLLLAAILIGLLIGGASSWINQRKWRKAARHSQYEAAHWRGEAARARTETSSHEGSLRLPSSGSQ